MALQEIGLASELGSDWACWRLAWQVSWEAIGLAGAWLGKLAGKQLGLLAIGLVGDLKASDGFWRRF